MCDAILAVKPDLVITEKGVSGTFKRLDDGDNTNMT